MLKEDTSNSSASISILPTGLSRALDHTNTGFDILWFKDPETHKKEFDDWADHLGFPESTRKKIWSLITKRLNK